MFILKVPIHKYLLTMLFVIHANFVASNFYEEKEPELQPKLNVTVCKPDRTSCRSESYDGDFGKHSPKMGGSGWLLAPVKNNKSGCKEFKTKVSVNPWIALISRGECDFTEKIDNAYKHNATAVIVYNNKEDSGDLVMSHKESQNIVAIFVKKSIGQDLAAALENGTNVVYVEITVVSRPSGEFQLNPASVLFVSVSFIVLMVISLAWLVFYYVQRFRYVHARDKTEKRLTSAAKKAITKLPTRTLSKKDEEDEKEICAVCLDGYKAGDVMRILPCQHIFHKLCIDPWLVEHRTCPMCKLNILKELGLPCEVQRSRQDVEVGTSELQAQEDHQNAADNPVVALADMAASRTEAGAEAERRLSCDEESSGSSNESGRILRVSAEVNWEREDHSSSTSNLVPSSSVQT